MSIELSSPEIVGCRHLQIDAGSQPVCLFLDGAFYRERIGIPEALGALGLRAATLTAGSGADRHRDFTCSDAYARFITHTVLPRIDGEVALLVGVSLSGLAVAHLSMSLPSLFPRIVSQSPSAWWDDESLVGRLRASGGAPGRAWFSVGTEETQTDVRHPPTAMHQKTSQWDSVARLAQAWGPSATLRPFEGGHEAAGWTRELDAAVRWTMGDGG